MSIYSTYRENFKKSLERLLEKLVENVMLSFELSISSDLRKGSRSASRHFPKSVILASCDFVGRPFVACHVCSIVIFIFSHYSVFNC